MNTWILVADAGKAKIYSSDNLRIGKLELVKALAHPGSRKKTTDLVTDRQGRYKANGCCGGAYSQKHDPKAVEAEHFALVLAKELVAAKGHGQYKDLIIVAPAHFYSLVHNHIAHDIKELRYLTKDYTRFDVAKLTASLQQHFVVLK